MRNRIYKRNGNWYKDYTDTRTARRVRKMIGPVSKAKASAILAKETAANVEKRWLDVDEQPRITFEAMAAEYMAWAKVNTRASTRYEESLRVLLPEFGAKLLQEITAASIEQWRVRRLQTVKASTSNRDLTVIKAIYTKAIAWEKAKESPARRVKFLKEHNERIVYLSAEDEAKLMAGCTEHLRPMVVLALHTGMRHGEILALKWADVDRQEGHVHVRDSKNGLGRSIPMNQAAREALAQAVSVKHFDTKSPYVFCNSAGEPYGSVKTSFRNALRRGDLLGRGYTFHTLRHTFASNLANAGVSLQTIGSLLGHRDIRMTMRYAHLSPGIRRDAVAILDRKGTERALEGIPVERYNRKA